MALSVSMRHRAATALLGAIGIAGCGTSSQPAASSPVTPPLPTGVQRLFINSAIKIDITGRAVTLPLFAGRSSAGKTFYVVTDSSDRDDATKRKVNYAPKLALALGTKAVEKVTVGTDGVLTFPGTVKFGLDRTVKPGPNGFPPDAATPGAIGDAQYSPLITTDGKTVLNATQVANDSGQHNGIITIDKGAKQVTLKLLGGFTGGAKVVYLRLDASSPVVAALEESTLAANLDSAPGLGSNDPATSSRSAIVPIVNGARAGSADRQGLQSAVLGEGEPLNIQQTLPNDLSYSPVWDVTPAVWSDAAIAAARRKLLTSASEVIAAITTGDLGSGGAGPSNNSLAGLKAAGFISNCPTVALLKS